MNGGVDHPLSEEVINLTRGPSGLGFNIVGGTDQKYISNDSGIYVNGKELTNMLHNHAVELFRTAGNQVSLKVQHRVRSLSAVRLFFQTCLDGCLLPQNGPSSHRGDGEPGGIPLAMILVPGLALTVAAVWAILRYRQRV
ncbi:hypothetical protein lerEdw1_017217 [Lerista edwardsae]|nr:hypothetical protein lerEdw1_017217 [Lerista edwardsae]